jgi:hypothetical protein
MSKASKAKKKKKMMKKLEAKHDDYTETMKKAII